MANQRGTEYSEKMRQLDELCRRGIKEDPGFRRSTIILNEAAIRLMLQQTHVGKYAVVRVERTKNVVSLEWKFIREVECSDDFLVVGAMTRIPFIPDPDPEKFFLQNIIYARGSGDIILPLSEGIAYFFTISFHRSCDSATVQGVESSTDTITFSIAIPPSDETVRLLEQVTEIESDPGGRIKHELERFQRQQDAYEEVLARTIKQIKAKGLTIAEEQKQIEDLEDYAAYVKQKFGV